MTAPTTREELTDEDYRAIARAAREVWLSEDDKVFIQHKMVADHFPNTGQAVAERDLIAGRAAVAEYERRRK